MMRAVAVHLVCMRLSHRVADLECLIHLGDEKAEDCLQEHAKEKMCQSEIPYTCYPIKHVFWSGAKQSHAESVGLEAPQFSCSSKLKPGNHVERQFLVIALLPQ